MAMIRVTCMPCNDALHLGVMLVTVCTSLVAEHVHMLTGGEGHTFNFFAHIYSCSTFLTYLFFQEFPSCLNCSCSFQLWCFLKGTQLNCAVLVFDASEVTWSNVMEDPDCNAVT